MKKYRVIWEVSKYALVEAENEEDAIEQVHNGKAEQFEDEITLMPEAQEIL